MNEVKKSLGFGIWQIQVQIQFRLLALTPWAGHLASVSLSFHIYEKGTFIVCALGGHGEEECVGLCM